MKNLLSNLFLTLSLVILLTASVFTWTPTALAQLKPDLDLTISPVTTYLTLKPDTTQYLELTLQHKGTNTLEFKPEIHLFQTDGLTGQPIPGEIFTQNLVQILDDKKQPLKTWTMQPQTSRKIYLKINPHSTHNNHEYPLNIIFLATPEGNQDFQTQAKAAGAVATNLIITVTELEDPGLLKINKINTHRVIDSFSTIKAQVILENVSHRAVAAKGKVEIFNTTNNKVKDWFIYPDVVLAGKTRQLRVINKNPEELEPGEVVELPPIEYKSPFFFGFYNLTTTLELANGGTEQLTVRIAAFPFSIIAIIILVILCYFGYRRWEKKDSQRAKHS